MSERTSPDAAAGGPGASSDDPALGAPERLHPLFLLTGLGGSLRGMTGGYAFIAYLAVSGRLEYALLAAVALLAMLAIGIMIYWRRFEYRVGTREIRIDSGILSRTHRSIPFDRIHDVEISQGPIARLVRVARVKFETGGSAGAGEEEGALHAIALDRAQDIRTLIRERRSDALEQRAVIAEEERPRVYAMDNRRLLLAGLFNFSLALFAGLFGLSQTAGDLLGFDPLRREFWLDLLSAGHPLADFVLQHRIATAAAGIVLLLLAGVLTGLVRTVLRDHGFRLDKAGAGLRRRRGLLTRSDVSIPAARAQAGIIATGPVRDAFGWRELKVQSLASDEGKGDHVLAPLATDGEVGTILGELGWRPVAGDADWKPVSSAYVWLRVIGLWPLYLVCLVIAVPVGFAWTLLQPETRLIVLEQLAPMLITLMIVFGAIILAIAARYLAWRRLAFALDGDRLLIRTGWWRRRLLILPIRRIQSIDFRQNFAERWFSTASLIFGVAGGSGFSAHRIPALGAEKARDLRRQLLSELS